MKRLTLVIVVGVLAVVVISAGERGSSAAAPCTTTLAAGSDIQAAINAATPGDVICLQPGLYSPLARINIDKSITLQGPQAGVDPRPSYGSTRTAGDLPTEAVVDGGGLPIIFRITASYVVLDGLDVRNASADMIDSPPDTAIANVALRYNILRDTTLDEAVQLRSCTNCVAEYNHVYNLAQDGINLCCGSTGGYIRYNEVHNCRSENAAIYVYNATYMTIQCNLVYDVLYNDGIKLGTKGGGDAGLPGGWILYNTVHDTAQDGISVYTSDTVVEGNEVYNSSSENGAIYVAWPVSDVAIQYNDVHDNLLDTGKWGNPGAIMIDDAVNAATVAVNHNNIYGNSPNGVTNEAPAALDATDNWWGAADGPSGAGGGGGDAVSTNVSFDPWLGEAEIITDPCAPDDEGPVTTNTVATPNPAAVGATVVLTANVDDAETGGSDIASAEYSYDGGSTWNPMAAQDVTFDEVSEDVTQTFAAPTAPGIYDLCVRGTDAAANTGDAQCIMLVVYDPAGGFVTGGGWIDSPVNTSYAYMQAGGKASFGFVSKYKKGATLPEGNTEFQFKAGNLNFHSSDYDWLVVTGGNYARFKGTGSINGAGAYKFTIWAGDGSPDTFRIKIWSEDGGSEVVAYDNGMEQAIGGGSIVVHTK